MSQRTIHFKVWDKELKEISMAMPLVMLAGYIMGLRARGRDLEDFQYLQGTGLEDKAKKEIFEGDILSSFDGPDARICEVYFTFGMFCCRYEPHNFEGHLVHFLNISNGEAFIKGSVQENPELLKGASK